MHFLGEQEPEFIEEVKCFMKVNESFLFACVVITVVFEFKNFFHFGLYNSYNITFDDKKTCTRICLKFFLDLQENEPLEIAVKNFFKIVFAVCNKIFLFWKKSCELNPKIRIIDFKQAEQFVFKMVKKVLEDEAEKKKVPSYGFNQIVEIILGTVITDKIMPFIMKH